MEQELSKLRAAHNKAAADTGVMQHVLAALIRQIPDKQRLLRDFADVMEHTTVTAMNSSVPEEFVQTSQLAVEMWRNLISMEIDEESRQRPAGTTQD